jgi:DNA ligase-4
MDVAFREPFVVEVLGSGYDKPAHERFLMLRHPRVKKIHRDRTWRDTVCMEELRQMAEQDRGMPSPDLNPDGIAADVTARVARYEQRLNTSQRTREQLSKQRLEVLKKLRGKHRSSGLSHSR